MDSVLDIKIGIYKITSPSNKIYIGQSNNILYRWKYGYFNYKCNKQTKLFNSLKKYGYENHKFEIIEECDINLLDEREIYWGECFNVLGSEGLNCRLGDGKGKLSEETKQKMRKPKSEEHRKNMSIAKIGIEYSKERNIKISQNKIGILKNELTKQKMRKPKSEEHRKNMILAKESSKKPILQYDLESNFIKEWESITAASNFYNCGAGTIGNNLTGISKTSLGYVWKYKL
jgi:group I intron endonuclease